MNSSEFNKGIIFAATGSLWWGVLGVIYFEYISFVGHIESVLHRAIWTSLFLVITTSYPVSYTHLTLPTILLV